MTYGQILKIGNTYECLDFEIDKWHKCEIIDVIHTKTGKIKAKVKNCSNEVFITDARKPSVILGKSVWERLEYKPKGNGIYYTSNFRNLTINN